ncbi:MAG: hypothetical protein WCW53_00635 [Syntrophales bacterium]|jgi:hypothetical protein
MKKIIAIVLLLLLAAPPAYCADKRYVKGYPRTTLDSNKSQTILAPGDYTTLVAGANGKSRGFLLLGLIPLWFATQSRAVNHLYENAAMKKEGTSLANFYRVKDHYYFILFTLTTCDVTADVIKLKTK